MSPWCVLSFPMLSLGVEVSYGEWVVYGGSLVSWWVNQVVCVGRRWLISGLSSSLVMAYVSLKRMPNFEQYLFLSYFMVLLLMYIMS